MSADEEEEFFGEVTRVDPVEELGRDAITRKTVRACAYCGHEGADSRRRCEHCGLVPAAAHKICLGCAGGVVFVGLLSTQPRPRTYEDALRIAGATSVPVCISSWRWWLCTVAPGNWSG